MYFSKTKNKKKKRKKINEHIFQVIYCINIANMLKGTNKYASAVIWKWYMQTTILCFKIPFALARPNLTIIQSVFAFSYYIFNLRKQRKIKKKQKTKIRSIQQPQRVRNTEQRAPSSEHWAASTEHRQTREYIRNNSFSTSFQCGWWIMLYLKSAILFLY